MKVLHGSNVDFNKFEIVDMGRNFLAEGMGIYMTDLEHVAKDYGDIIYTIDLDESNISDFTDKKYVEEFYKKIAQDTGVDFFNEIDMDHIVNCILTGDYSITSSPKEIYDCIDSDYDLYLKYEDMMEDMKDILEKSFLENIKDVIKYKAIDIPGNVFLCFRNVDKLNIVDKTYNN